MTEPISKEMRFERLSAAHQPAKSAQHAKGVLVWRPLENAAQQRRHNLQHRHSLAPYLLRKQRGVANDVVVTDVDARSYHERCEELPDGDHEALRRCLSDHVRGG